MSADARVSPESLRTRAQLWLWSRPEWWTVALCAAAWAAIVPSWIGGSTTHAHGGIGPEIAAFLLMVVAMMLPLSLDSVRLVAAASLWRRRHRAIAEMLCGYLVPWLALGVVAALLRQHAWAQTSIAAGAAFALGAAWQQTPVHARATMACHRRLPLAPTGLRATRDCVAYGMWVGAACAIACWPLMLACTFSGHSPLAMVAGLALAAFERWSFWPRPRALAVGTLGVAALYVSVALLTALAVGCRGAPASPERSAILVAQTEEPIAIGGPEVRVTLRVTDKASFSGVGPGGARAFLNVEGIRAATACPPIDVYLATGAGGDSLATEGESPSGTLVGTMSLFGLATASDPARGTGAGLTEKLEVTEALAELLAPEPEGPRTLLVTLVSSAPDDPSTARATRITLFVEPAPSESR